MLSWKLWAHWLALMPSANQWSWFMWPTEVVTLHDLLGSQWGKVKRKGWNIKLLPWLTLKVIGYKKHAEGHDHTDFKGMITSFCQIDFWSPSTRKAWCTPSNFHTCLLPLSKLLSYCRFLWRPATTGSGGSTVLCLLQLLGQLSIITVSCCSSSFLQNNRMPPWAY